MFLINVILNQMKKLLYIKIASKINAKMLLIAFILAFGGVQLFAARYAEVLSNPSYTFSSNGTFSGYYAASADGGFIRADNSTVYINPTNVTFSNNSAHNGGVFYFTNSKGFFSGNSISFLNNSATLGGGVGAPSGGAIFATVNSSVVFNTNNIVFRGNVATQDGPAVFSRDNAYVGFGTPNGTVLMDSHNGGFGGAIYTWTATIDFYGAGLVVTISNNRAINEAGAIFATRGGGGIKFRNGTVNLNNNYAGGSGDTNGGGAMSIYDEIGATATLFENEIVNFTSNSALNFGGVI
ncbi:MAG: hypothetical protein LBN20_06470, partial [Endomicrobium sp.]|nr:hypothetical protein [Endomicrobium sp.]